MSRLFTSLALVLALAAPAAAEDVEPAEELAAPEAVRLVPESTVHGSAHLCDVAGAGANIKAGGFSVSVPTYPCEVARTYETLDGLQSRGGFLAGAAKVFLHARLVTRGIFSSIFGLIGLG